jgi:hypothetical protein
LKKKTSVGYSRGCLYLFLEWRQGAAHLQFIAKGLADRSCDISAKMGGVGATKLLPMTMQCSDFLSKAATRGD